MIYTKDFIGENDNVRIENAIKGRGRDGQVVIEAKANGEPWMLDRAILLPSNTTVILRNCRIKLSDLCRDNFFRTANCGLGIEDPEMVTDIHIIGEGNVILEGADHPRATGDSSKSLANPCPFLDEDLCKYGDWIPEERRLSGKLDFWDRHNHSFGTDAGDESQSQYGDWRGIGILFANVDRFSVENLTIVRSHGWGISVEAGTNGIISRITFDSCMSGEIDGILQNMENQDGIDLRNGCNNITISDISGNTGDDVIALTAIAKPCYCPGGALKSTHVMHSDWKRRDPTIHDIIINNVRATSHLCWVIRMLPAQTRIYNVIVNGVIDTGDDLTHSGTILLGERDDGYGENYRDGLQNIIVSNVISNGKDHGIGVLGFLKDSVISTVSHRSSKSAAIKTVRENAFDNVTVTGIIQTDKTDKK